MNRVTLVGRLTFDPELKFTPGSGMAVVNLKLAVDKYNKTTKQKEADFIPIVVWGEQAENVATYMKKGSLIAVGGRLQSRNYEAKDGGKRNVIEIVASEVQFLDRKKSEPAQEFEDMTPVEDEGEMPF